MTRFKVRKVDLTLAQMEKVQVRQERSMREGMAAIDYVGLGLALVVNEESRVVGLVTDGDIRRAILRGISIDVPISDVMNRSPVIAREVDEDSGWAELLSRDLQSLISEEVGLKVPVVDRDNRVVEMVILRKQDRPSHSSARVRPVKGVLVVGGAGYLGSVLCRMLLRRGYRVRVLDSLLYGVDPIAELEHRPGFELVMADMRHLEEVTRAMKSVDAVIHLAAIVGDEASRLDPEETIEANHLATRTVAEVSRYYQVNRFIFASTCSNYGASSQPDASFSENSPLNPLSLYARMKVESEQALRELEDGNFAPTIFRMATLFGLSPRMRFDLVVNNFVVRAMREKVITVFGGTQWRPELHVLDAAEAFVKCLEAPIERVRGEIFNVGGNALNCRIEDVAKLVAEKVPGTRMVVQGEKVDPRSYRVSFDKAERVLGFRPRMTVRDGIREIAEAVKGGMFCDWPSPRYSNAMYLGMS
jgi:nucleoside-diphosphate-sugar epimerase